MKQFRFLDWEVYKDARRLFLELHDIHKRLSLEEKKSLGDQMLRSSLSVSLNVAEGSGKWSNREQVKFIDIALGSLYETRATVDMLHNIDRISPDELECFETNMSSIANQLGGLRRETKRKM